MIWFLTTLAALAAAFYIAAPFYRESSLRSPAGAPLRQKQRELEAQREALLRELKELEFDRRMGKVDEEQYATTRANVTREASRVLRQIEALNSPSAPAAPRRPRVEKPAEKPSAVAPTARFELEIELEVAVARARRSMKNRAQANAWTCSCGRAMQLADRFCGSCGQPMQAEAKATSVEAATV